VTTGLGSTTQYLVEVFTSRRDGRQIEADAERLCEASEALARAGHRVRYLQSLFVPEEETGFHLLEADCLEGVERALSDAGLEAERINPAIALPGHA
jgi:hypothetical protein